MSDLSIASDGRDAPAAFRGKVATADRAGCTRIWIANHLFQRDPIALAGAALEGSARLPVALMAMSPFTVHPVQLAMAAATLDEFHPGRVSLCLGSGAPADLGSVGIDNSKPLGALQCGFCTPGFVLAVKALLAFHPAPTDDEIKHFLRGNICRCTGYVKILEAVKSLV